MKEGEAEVEQGGGHRLSVDEYMALLEMPAPGTYEEHGGLFFESVVLAFSVGELDRAPDGVAQVDLSGESRLPGGGVGILEIGHKDLGARIEGIDDHLPIDGTGDLDAPVLKVGGDRSHPPCVFADLPGLGKEIGEHAFIEFGLAVDAVSEQFAPPRVEIARELGHKGKGWGIEDLGEFGGEPTVGADLYAFCRSRQSSASWERGEGHYKI